MGSFLADLAKTAAQRGKARERLGMQEPPSRREEVPPPNPSGPGKPTSSRPAKTTPGTPSPAAASPGGAEPPRASPIGPVPAELQSALERMLGASKPRMISEELRRVGAPGADSRHHFFNLFGHMPTPRQLSSFRLRLNLEQRLGRPPTVQEVKQALVSSDFIDRTPEPLALSQPGGTAGGAA